MADRLGQGQGAEEVGGAVGQGVQLQPHRVHVEAAAGQSGPDDRVLAFFDVLLGGASLIVEQRPRSGGLAMLVTMKPTRGYNSPGCRSTFATTRRDLVHDAAW